MTEIEIKAHVEDPSATLELIRSFAEFSGEMEKLDAYWMRAGTNYTHMLLAAVTGIFTFLAALAAAGCAILGAPKEAIILICLFASMMVGVASITALRKQKALKHLGEDDGMPVNAVKVRIREERASTASGDPAKNTAITVTYKKKEMKGNVEVNDEREFSIDDRAAFETFIGDLGFSAYITKKKQTKSFVFVSNEGSRGEIPVTIELSLVEKLGWFVELEILASEPDEDFIARAREILSRALAQCGIPESAIEPRFYTEMIAAAESATAQ